MADHIRFTPNISGVRLESGLSVWDEALINGRYVTRYRSASGQILPEMHLTTESLLDRAGEFPLDSFFLQVNGKELTQYELLQQGEVPDDTGLFGAARVFKTKLQSKEEDVCVTVCTRLDGSRFTVRWLEIENTDSKPMGINAVQPLAGRVWLHDGTPFAHPIRIQETGDMVDFSLAYCHQDCWGCEGDFYFSPLASGDFHYNGGNQGRSGWSRPAFWLRDNQSGQIMAVEFAYGGNWEFSVLTKATEKTVQAAFAIGIPAIDGEYIRVLSPGETVRTPAVHSAHFPCCGLSQITQAYHEHLRGTVMPTSPKGHEVEVEANHRGYLCDRENEPDILADIDVAYAAGAELYVIDAGWYGSLPNHWWDNVGDWYYGTWLPNGLKPIADYAHGKGMRFGLWIEIEAIGKNAVLGKEHPDWRMKRDGEYCAPYGDAEGGRALDLSKPEVVDWIEKTVSRYIEELNLDMYRIDHNHCIGVGGNRMRFGLKENVMWTYFENFYAMLCRLRTKYPSVVFQNCAGGGGRLDFGTLGCFHNTEVSDWARPPRVGKIINNLSMLLPPEKMLCIFGTETLGLEQEYDLFSQLCAVLGARPIFRGIAPSIEEMNPHMKQIITGCMTLYKQKLRPILKEAVVFHHTPMLPIFQPTHFAAVEYAAKEGADAFLLIRGMNPTDEKEITVYPRSIAPDKRYIVTCVQENTSWAEDGWQIRSTGVRLYLTSAEIVLLEEIQ